MQFRGIGKITKDDQGNVTETLYVVEMSEKEVDMVTGIAGKPHVASRYKPGRQVNIASIYEKVEKINNRHDAIIAAAAKVKTYADDIANAIPLT